jgi:hypothetical protein
MATKQVTDWLRRIHYRADRSARVIDCFRVEVMDVSLLACSFNRPNVTLKQLWEEALDTAKYLQNSFQQRVQRDWRQFGLKGPNDLRPFAMIWGCEEEREKVKYQVKFDMMIGECGAAHMERVLALGNVLDGDEWLSMN